MNNRCPQCQSANFTQTTQNVKSSRSPIWSGLILIGILAVNAGLLFILNYVASDFIRSLGVAVPITLFVLAIVDYILIVRMFGTNKTLFIKRCTSCGKTWHELIGLSK